MLPCSRLAQEVARYLGAVSSTAGTQRQEPLDSTERPNVTTLTIRDSKLVAIATSFSWINTQPAYFNSD